MLKRRKRCMNKHEHGLYLTFLVPKMIIPGAEVFKKSLAISIWRVKKVHCKHIQVSFFVQIF